MVLSPVRPCCQTRALHADVTNHAALRRRARGCTVMVDRHSPEGAGWGGFAARLRLILKVLTISRGQLAALLQVDKSVISRWLSGANVPSDHNLARLTTIIAQRIPGFTMLDWEAADVDLLSRLGVDSEIGVGVSVTPPFVVDEETGFPLMERLPALATSMHETLALGSRYLGLWRSWMPTVGLPDAFHCEHVVIRSEGAWLSGDAVALSYRKPVVGLIANGQLILILSDANYYIVRLFNRADGPIVDQVDGLMLAAASLPHQAPTACRVLMQRILPADAGRAVVEEKLEELQGERRLLTAQDLPPELLDHLVPTVGLAAAAAGGERLLRADVTKALVKTRWF